MRILVEVNSAVAARRSYAEFLWGATFGVRHTHGTLRRWSVSWWVRSIGIVPEDGDVESKVELPLESRADPPESSVALTAEHVAALAAAIRQIQLRGIPENEYFEEFVDGWSTTLTIAYGYSSVAFKWANDSPPAEWLGVDAVMETIHRIQRELP